MSDGQSMEWKAAPTAAVLDVSGREVSLLYTLDNLDRVGDVTSLKAFNRSIGLGLNRISHVFMHDGPCIGNLLSIDTVARRDLPEDVQREYPDATGGKVAISRMNEQGLGLDVLSGIRNGVPYGCSYGFVTKKASPHPTIRKPDGTPARHLEEVHLLEITTARPGTAINLATRSSLQKTLDFLTEMKAGRRHSESDVDLLNQIAALVLSLGATIIPGIPEPAEPETVRTSVDALLDEIGSLFEVAL